MGLREELQADLKEAFDEDLSDAVRQLTLSHVSKDLTVYDPLLGTNTRTTVDYSTRGIFTNYSTNELFNSTIEPTDSKLIIIANELDVVPQIQDKITDNESRIYNIIGQLHDPINATYELQVRAVYG